MRFLWIGAAGVEEVQADLRRLPSNQQELLGSLTSLTMNGYNFTERVRKVLALAREEAADMHIEYVGTEHILLAMIREGGGTAFSVLTNFGVNGRQLRSRLLETVPPTRKAVIRRPDLPYSSRAKKTLELAMTEARTFNHSYVGTEHLLLGLLREEKGVAAQVLNEAGVTLAPAREETLRVLAGAGSNRGPVRASRETFVAYPQRLREVMADAYDLAAERGALEVTPAHAMIALFEHGEGMANTALDRLRLDREAALFALDDLAPKGPPVPPDVVIDASSQLHTALLAMEHAQHDMRSPVPGTQHLLIGLMSASLEVAAVFAAQGIERDLILAEVRRGTG
ncbi:MAG: Clp protease N-terminal domain-containing protein [Gemmatimonadaceae bacterium]